MYRAILTQGIYRLVKIDEELKTPAGNDLICESQDLAELLANHLNAYGEGHEDPVSIAAFHYPWLDFGQIISRDKLELSMAMLLNPKDDWTLHNPFAAKEIRLQWESAFGETSRQIRLGRKWLAKLSVPQLLAVSVIQRKLGSVNLSYLAHAMEDEQLDELASSVRDYLPQKTRPAVSQIQAALSNFRFYYRLDENGGG